MNYVENATLFWKIVVASLVRFYGFNEQDAFAKANPYFGKMTPLAIKRNNIYHSQPLHIAAKLAGVLMPISDAALVEYDVLVERLRAEMGASNIPQTLASPREAAASSRRQAA